MENIYENMDQLAGNAKVKLPEEKCPNVIDKEMIVEALNLTPKVTGGGRGQRHAASDEDDGEEDDHEFELRTACTLRLEFRRILCVENLQKLTSLTRLFLDNNLIEEISGLDDLVHLEWIDLSFNRIQRIQGLDFLMKLEVLALYGNQIERLENLAHLRELKVLRVGSNRLRERQDIIYLRKLSSLRTLSIKENPLCESEQDWQGFVMAMLPDLAFLECHAVPPAQRAAAITR